MTDQLRNLETIFSKQYLQYNFKGATWNILEAGYGKGPTDGISAAIKMHADKLALAQDKDRTKARDLLNGYGTTATSVRSFLVDIPGKDTLYNLI